MKVIDYPYVATKTFKKAVGWLNRNENYIKTLAGLPGFEESFAETNWGMPKTIYLKLNDKQKKWLNEQTLTWLQNRESSHHVFDKPIVTVPVQSVAE